MKKTLLSLFFLLFVTVFTQAQTSIRGSIIDSIKHEPLSYVTVSLANIETGLPFKSTLTDNNGRFELNNIPVQPLRVLLSFVGYRSKTINLTGKAGPVDLGSINLSPAAGQLKEVAVTASKPLLKREIDRLIYDVQADPDNRTDNTLEIIRKVPMLSVDGYEKIRLKGSGSFKVLINGKESALTAHNPEEVLKAMPALNVERIEVITTPPARYDGEGLAGIINIVTKKNADQGYNVNSNLNYDNVYGPQASSTLTAKKNRFGITGFVSYSYRPKLTNPLGSVRETYAPATSTLTQDGNIISGNGYHNEGIVNISFDIDSLNLLTAGYGNYTENAINQLDQVSAEYDPNRSLLQRYRSFEDGNTQAVSQSAEFDYQRGFKTNKEQLLTVSYKFDDQANHDEREVSFSDRINYGGANYRQPTNTGSTEHTAQADYAKPLQRFLLESGVKAIVRNNHSSYDYEQYNGSAFTLLPALSNQFNYRQIIYSAYTSARFTGKTYAAKAGLRLERTLTDADFTSSAQTIRQQYNTLLPSLSVQRNFKDWNLTLGAANRLMRPGIWELNPFVDRSNPAFFSTGNPDLQPVIMHTLELNYTNVKHNITTGLSYQLTNNDIENVRTILPDTVILRQPKNIGKLKNLTLNGSFNKDLTKQWRFSTNGQVSYVSIAGTDNGVLMRSSGYQGTLALDTSYQFNNTGWRVSANAAYYTAYVEFQGNSNDYFYSSFKLSKELAGKKLLLSLTANNPSSPTVTLHGGSHSTEFNRQEYFTDYYRTIAFAVNYKFGRLKSDIKKSQHSINNDDLRGGKG